jgi:hypothetical protein
MKDITILFLVFFLFTLKGFAQDVQQNQSKWVRIETDNKELSISFPQDYLVNNESNNNNNKTTIIGFQNGVSIKMSFSKQTNSKENLGRIRVDKTKEPTVLDFKVNDFFGKSITYSKNEYRSNFFLASKNFYYIIEVSAQSKEKSEVTQFLQSIRLKDQPLIVADSNINEPNAEVISAKSLKTSPQIIEVLKRKTEKAERKISFESLTNFKEEAIDYTMRPAFLLANIGPELTANFNGVTKGGEVKVRLQLLSNGQVGDIIVFSDVDKSVLRSYANAAKNVKFIPAQKNGTPIDSYQTVWSYFGVSVTTQILSTE